MTRLAYTGIGEVARRVQPDGTEVAFEYDTEERLVKVTNERGEEYTLDRDHLGRIVGETDYWGNTRKYAYDSAGNLVRSEDPLGRVTAYEYDPLGRLGAKILTDGTREEFKYDANGNLAGFENGCVKVERIFDEENLLVGEKQGSFEVANAYDLNGNRILRESSHGNTVAFEYDILGNVSGVGINGNPVVQIERNDLDQTVREVLSGRIERDYEYNKDGLLTGQKIRTPDELIVQRGYRYDRAGNLIEKSDSAKGNSYFTYDPLGRVSEYVNPEGKIKRFLHDPAGDLLRHGTDTGGERTASYDGTNYWFDAAGNLVERESIDGRTIFEWDDNNRLIAAENGDGQRTGIAYDAVGRRICKETGGDKTAFAWDGDCILSDSVGENGPREFVFYPGTFEPLAMIDSGGEICYFNNDAVGLPQEVCDSDGKVVWSAVYDALGGVEKLLADEIDNPLRFQGQYFDPEIGLSYNRFRYFDPCVGAFVSQDPLGLAAGVSVYSYAPNVWGWVDPLGLTECSTVLRVDETQFERVKIKSDGTVEIPIVKTKKGRERELFINIGQQQRAETFLRKRTKQGKPAKIKEFQVEQSFVDKLRRDAVLESEVKDFPGRPVRVDLPHKDQFGLKTSEQIQALREAIIQGSGKVQ